MADSGAKMFMLRQAVVFLLSFAVCLFVVAAAAPAPAPAPAPVNNTNSTTTTPAINTSSSPSISTLDSTDGGGRSTSSTTLCLHKASTHAYDGVVALKDGSGRLLCWNRDGQVWLASSVDVGTTGSVLRVGAKPLIDLRAAVRGRGLAGVAVDSSTRVYVSYYNSTAGGAFLVVDQLSASWSEHEPTATAATRLFSKALPAESEPDYYGGQILFRPTTNDPNLYLVTGPAQTNGQFQAEILRLPVGEDMPSGGNGAYASVLGIPRRCAFDVDRPQDLYCAIVKDDQELVYLTSDPDAPSYSAPAPIPSLLVAIQRPTPETPPPSLVGGMLYRGDADTTLAGSYIYMYGSEFWVAGPSPAHNSTTARNLQVTCSTTATTPCRGGDDFVAAVTSFGEDADKNAILLATDATYQVVAPSLCDGAPSYTNPKPQAPSPPSSNDKTKGLLVLVFKVIGGLLLSLGLGYGTYKLKTIIFKCCYTEYNTHT